MVPSSHILLKESPQEAAKRMMKEQLELEGIVLSGPTVVSETYLPKRFPDLPSHWDIEFIFRGELTKERIPRSQVWTELAFVNLSRTSKSEMARSHEDVLQSTGLTFAEDSRPT
jgi:hypothetical protein